MKISGWICVVVGGLALIGAIIAGSNTSGPLSCMGLGITLLYFANHKNNNKEQQSNNE